jgi:hypothetical protein
MASGNDQKKVGAAEVLRNKIVSLKSPMRRGLISVDVRPARIWYTVKKNLALKISGKFL